MIFLTGSRSKNNFSLNVDYFIIAPATIGVFLSHALPLYPVSKKP